MFIITSFVMLTLLCLGLTHVREHERRSVIMITGVLWFFCLMVQPVFLLLFYHQEPPLISDILFFWFVVLGGWSVRNLYNDYAYRLREEAAQKNAASL